MLDNFQWDIKLLMEFDEDIVSYANWLNGAYKKRKRESYSNHTQYENADRDGFLGEFALYNWLHQHYPKQVENSFSWDGYQLHTGGDAWDYRVSVTTPERSGYLRLDNKNRLVKTEDRKWLGNNFEVYVIEGTTGATQIEKPIEIYTFTGIINQQAKYNGEAVRNIIKPLLLGWEWKEVILKSWRVAEKGEQLYANTDLFKASQKTWLCPVGQLRKIDDLPSIFYWT